MGRSVHIPYNFQINCTYINYPFLLLLASKLFTMPIRSICLATLFVLFAIPSINAQSNQNALVFKKLESKKELSIDYGKSIRIKTLDGTVIKGKLTKGNQDLLIVNSDTIATNNIEWLNQKVLLKPLGVILAIGGTTMVLFGTAAWATNVGSDDTWSSLGAVVGALIGISGGIIDVAALPILLKSRKFRIGGNKANWLIAAA